MSNYSSGTTLNGYNNDNYSTTPLLNSYLQFKYSVNKFINKVLWIFNTILSDSNLMRMFFLPKQLGSIFYRTKYTLAQ